METVLTMVMAVLAETEETLLAVTVVVLVAVLGAVLVVPV